MQVGWDAGGLPSCSDLQAQPDAPQSLTRRALTPSGPDDIRKLTVMLDMPVRPNGTPTLCAVTRGWWTESSGISPCAARVVPIEPMQCTRYLLCTYTPCHGAGAGRRSWSFNSSAIPVDFQATAAVHACGVQAQLAVSCHGQRRPPLGRADASTLQAIC